MSIFSDEDLGNIFKGRLDKVDIQKAIDSYLPEYDRKYKLSEKVLSGERLSISEKQEICRLLTGKELLLTKRGRPSAKERNSQLAYEYLSIKEEGKKGLGTYRGKLASKYGIPQKENTFYKAIASGIEALELKAKDFFASLKNRHDYYDRGKLQDFDINMIQDDIFVTEIITDKNIADQIFYWRHCRKLIQKYRAESNHLKK